MRKGEYFKIETIEELREAYEMFKDEWWKQYPLDAEVMLFTEGKKDRDYRFIAKNYLGICLHWSSENLKEIPSPLKKKPRQIIKIEDLVAATLLEDEFILVEPGKINQEQEKLFKRRHFMLNYSYNNIDFWWDTSGHYKHYHYKKDESIIEKSNLQKTLEIGDLNIKILKYLTANDIVDSSLRGQEAQNIVDKIDELSRIILK